MNIILIEVNPDDISINEDIFPNTEKNGFIFEHLRYYCSKFYSLPTITIKVCAEGVFVVHGHQYLLIAKELKHQHIRAIVDNSSSDKYVQSFLKKPFVVQLDWEVARIEGNDELVEYTWYVFFFKKQLNQEEKKLFEEHIVEFFKQIQLPGWAKIPDNRIINLTYYFSNYCAEFQAYVPTEDERWYAESIKVLVKFHLNCVPIASFQGRKFTYE
ncbi:hypothetical protein NIES4072_67820 [Nostoc commune NIES-4072]|uniref:Uncharacterized protein n=1 Tax=Nostoc commune NIES-4072 TaxID=2005467 RepID=A0A2R5FWI4_NOSCO|nr:hypothetical protein [Nostoc commune]BBD70416.1 hypothetical protein NIES4070_68270 [Nostoc commune HK-02]GBG23070.1 hypothetical protein NIES4072_67820 [Nostoc commune NIES-4072]